MVGTRHPASVLALHAGAAYKDILNGLVEHVSHVEYTRHIGWRNNHRIRLAPIWL